jgi:transposase
VVSTAQSLTELEQAALRGAPEQTHLTVVIEPTGPMWLPIAVYFGRRGHTVLRVSSAKAADLRRFLSRHAKSNNIDAETLARLPMVAPAGLHPVELGGAARASLDRRVRAVARLTREIGQRKVRIRALAQTLMPTIGDALGDGLNRTDLAVLERYGPHSSSGARTPPSRCLTSSRRSPPKSGCCGWPKPNAPVTKQPATPRWPTSIRPDWPPAYPVWAR